MHIVILYVGCRFCVRSKYLGEVYCKALRFLLVVSNPCIIFSTNWSDVCCRSFYLLCYLPQKVIIFGYTERLLLYVLIFLFNIGAFLTLILFNLILSSGCRDVCHLHLAFLFLRIVSFICLDQLDIFSAFFLISGVDSYAA